MKKFLTLLLCLMLPATALADGLTMYDDTMLGETFPGNAPVRLYLSDFNWVGDYNAQASVDLQLDQRVPVYAYPDEHGWRATEGKAAVSLLEPFTALAWTADEQWLLIDYEIGERDVLGVSQHRIGYIRRDALPEGFTCPVGRENLVRVEMRLARAGHLYDDINGRKLSVGQLAAGQTVTVLGYVNNAWAFVETRMEGKLARFFLPMAVLEKPAETEDKSMMAALEGLWVFAGGGEILSDGCSFDGAGNVRFYRAGEYENFPTTVLIPCEDREPCAYSVYPNTLGSMRYPSAPFVLELRGQNGAYDRMGINLYTDEAGVRHLDVQYGPGGGGYRFVTAESGVNVAIEEK